MQSNEILIRKVHKEKSVVVLSAIFLAILALTDAYLLIQIVTDEIPYVLGIGLFSIIAATIIISYWYAPMSVVLFDESLTLFRGIGKKKFNCSDISVIDIYNIGDAPAVRICGIGGIWGFVGRYYAKPIGHYFSYVGDYSQTFYVRLKNGKKYLFSCEDRDLIVLLVKKKISQ